MTDYMEPLETLYARFDAIAEGRASSGGRPAHEAVIARLAENQCTAEARGWTSCALERVGGSGRLHLWGIPPTGYQRELVPDWRVRE